MNKYKNFILVSLILITILGMLLIVSANEDLLLIPAEISIDGKRVNFNYDMGYPHLLRSAERTLVPLRIISENMGYKVDWSEETWHKGIRKVWVENAKTKLELQIGNRTALANGKQVPIDVDGNNRPTSVAPMLVESRTYVPLRFTTETLGGKVEYEMVNGVHIIDIITGDDQAGLKGFTPKDNIRIKKQGGGINFVHGGISLQEIVVPLIRYRHLRNDSKEYLRNRDKYDVKPVELNILSTGRKISNMIFNLSFYQSEMLSTNREAANFLLYCVDEYGEKVSDEVRIIADCHR